MVQQAGSQKSELGGNGLEIRWLHLVRRGALVEGVKQGDLGDRVPLGGGELSGAGLERRVGEYHGHGEVSAAVRRSLEDVLGAAVPFVEVLVRVAAGRGIGLQAAHGGRTR